MFCKKRWSLISKIFYKQFIFFFSIFSINLIKAQYIINISLLICLDVVSGVVSGVELNVISDVVSDVVLDIIGNKLLLKPLRKSSLALSKIFKFFEREIFQIFFFLYLSYQSF